MMTDTRDERAERGSDAQAATSVRYPTAIAVGGGVAAAVGSSFIPMNAIEGFVGAYGIAELLPAAAPPLGNTARLALSAGIGTLTAGALLALLPRGETDVMGYENAEKHDTALENPDQDTAMAPGGFGASKLAGWLRTLRFGKAEAAEGEVTDFADLSRLRVRSADVHPDAPVRAPIMASSDLGGPIETATDRPTSEASMAPAPLAFAKEPFDLEASMAFAPPEPAMPAPEPSLRFAPPVAVEADSEPAAVDPESDTPSNAVFAGHDNGDHETSQQQAAEAAPQGTTQDTADLANLGIPALLDRLESGLARRREQAGATVSASASDPSSKMRIIALTTDAGQAEGAPEAASPSDSEQPPLRFRIGQPRSDTDADNEMMASPGVSDASARWTDGTRLDASAGLSQDADQPATYPDTDSPVEMPVAEAAADDDMDAALRDALATLRQLSDRQRNL